MNIHGAHSHWKQGALGAAGVRRVWARAGPQRAAYRGGGISCGLVHSLFITECVVNVTKHQSINQSINQSVSQLDTVYYARCA